MVGVAQLVEPRIVIPVVAGSIPVVHPNLPLVNIEKLTDCFPKTICNDKHINFLH